MIITPEHVRAAVLLSRLKEFEEAQMQMAPAGRQQMQPDPTKPAPRQSAVLILVYPRRNSGLHLILTKRTEHLSGHSGQVSFPGGRCDPDDDSYEETALRETCEELGICDDEIEIVGRLSKLWIPPSNYDVYPVVGLMTYEPAIEPNPAEVERVLHMPLSALVDDAIKCSTAMKLRGQTVDVPYYDVEGYVVWGATCMMLSEFEQRLLQVLC